MAAPTNAQLYPIAREALQRSISNMVDPHPNGPGDDASRKRDADKMAAVAARLHCGEPR